MASDDPFMVVVYDDNAFQALGVLRFSFSDSPGKAVEDFYFSSRNWK
jgi:hypothetical protein